MTTLCGKTTVGRTLVRIDPPSSGTLSFEGREFVVEALESEQLCQAFEQWTPFQSVFSADGLPIRLPTEISRVGAFSEETGKLTRLWDARLPSVRGQLSKNPEGPRLAYRLGRRCSFRRQIDTVRSLRTDIKTVRVGPTGR